jgi:quercetin dioxygenase-like cupin family protein
MIAAKHSILVGIGLMLSVHVAPALAHPAPEEGANPSQSQAGAVVPATGGEVILQTDRGTETIKVTPEMSGQLGLATTHMRAPGMKITPHVHVEDDEAFFVHRGGGVFLLGDRKVSIAEGDIVFVPKGTVHGFENSSGDTFLVWAISSSKYLELHRMFFSGSNPSEAEVEELYRKYGFREAVPPP